MLCTRSASRDDLTEFGSWESVGVSSVLAKKYLRHLPMRGIESAAGHNMKSGVPFFNLRTQIQVPEGMPCAACICSIYPRLKGKF